MELIDGNSIAASLVAELKQEVAAMAGRPPCLALVRVGDDAGVGEDEDVADTSITLRGA